VTGDPDQSIYGWRGAKLGNILRFDRDFRTVRIVRLEQNYRSTPAILRVADQLISYNVNRKEKSLFSERPEGNPVRLATYPTGRAEADHIVAQIAQEVARGERRFRDYAIFYRINALSRSLETALRNLAIPYQIVRGLEFYQRKEIKDVLGYLHVLNNPRNDIALLRIINTPARGIGKKTLESGRIESLSKRAATMVAKFVALYDRLSTHVNERVASIIDRVLIESGYTDCLSASDLQEDHERLANIDELVSAVREFDEQHRDDGGLEAFLEQVSLVTDQDEWEDATDKVTLMTLHAAKGLEFPVVFIIAVEEGLLPHEWGSDDPEELEEERRLLFVGITRAKDELQLSLTHYRHYRGELRPTIPSQFLMELPRQQMQVIEPFEDESLPDWLDRSPELDDEWSESEYRQHWDDADSDDEQASRALPTADVDAAASPVNRRFPSHVFRSGMVVEHPKYGAGTITSIRGSGRRRTAVVTFFGEAGERSFELSHCRLTPVEYSE
jgi:DNA helicase-2/ATP-dependent DNA helicase PcrA